MRQTTGVAAIVIVAASTLTLAQRGNRDVSALMALTRDALGGEQQLSAVKTIVATGRTQQLRGNNLVPIEFEIDIELPDRYVRIDEVPAQGNGPTVAGFAGETLIQTKSPAVREDFARLTIALFASSFSGYPVTYAYAGEAEAPQGKADVFDVKGSGTALRLFIAQATHLPLMLTWQTPPPARGSSTTGAPQENRLYFADYRDVGKLHWPFRLRRAVGSDTVEETTFDQLRVNAAIDQKKFR
ncbi:MAG TPA: hypothetical protein VLV86_19235 [Vicinamibacterales bacterium]|nr:hypothetical protein [Vicinamibacterales bacterium]